MIKEIILFMCIVGIVGLYAINLNNPVLNLISQSTVYGPSSELYLIFIGIPFIIIVVGIYSIFSPKPQTNYWGAKKNV